MRLLLTTDTVGGVWTYCIELARALADHDVQIALAIMGERMSDEQRRQLDCLGHVMSFDGDYKLEWMPDPWKDVSAAGRWLLDIEHQFKADVVHLNGYAHGTLDWQSPVLSVAHSCVLSWWEAVRGNSAPAEWGRYRSAVRDGLGAADVVVAPTAAMLHAITRHYGEHPHLRIIPNARDSSLFHRAPKLPFIFSAGRLWDEAKNVAALTRIAPKLPWPIALAGDRGSHTGGDVRWLGRLKQPQMAAWLAHASIYALPAFYEPFGLSVLEAAISGCALVLGDIPSLRENWEGAAIFVKPQDDTQLQHILCRLIADADARHTLAERAMERARQFSPLRFAFNYLEVYRRLCAIGRSVPCES